MDGWHIIHIVDQNLQDFPDLYLVGPFNAQNFKKNLLTTLTSIMLKFVDPLLCVKDMFLKVSIVRSWIS